jgi:hypothetical protein
LGAISAWLRGLIQLSMELEDSEKGSYHEWRSSMKAWRGQYQPNVWKSLLWVAAWMSSMASKRKHEEEKMTLS